jgi:hypothetical protein
MIKERLTGILTTQLTGNPWLNKPINTKEIRTTNSLIKTIERLPTIDMDTVIALATGIPTKLWSLKDNVHIPSQWWSYVGKVRIKTQENLKAKDEMEEGEEEEKPGPHTYRLRIIGLQYIQRTDGKNISGAIQKRILEIDRRQEKKTTKKTKKIG